MLGFPSRLQQSECHFVLGLSLKLLSYQDTNLKYFQGLALIPPGIGSSVANDLGFHHSDRLLGDVMVVRKQPSMVLGRWLLKMSLYAMCRRQPLGQRAEEGRNLVGPSNFEE